MLRNNSFSHICCQLLFHLALEVAVYISFVGKKTFRRWRSDLNIKLETTWGYSRLLQCFGQSWRHCTCGCPGISPCRPQTPPRKFPVPGKLRHYKVSHFPATPQLCNCYDFFSQYFFMFWRLFQNYHIDIRFRNTCKEIKPFEFLNIPDLLAGLWSHLRTDSGTNSETKRCNIDIKLWSALSRYLSLHNSWNSKKVRTQLPPFSSKIQKKNSPIITFIFAILTSINPDASQCEWILLKAENDDPFPTEISARPVVGDVNLPVQT